MTLEMHYREKYEQGREDGLELGLRRGLEQGEERKLLELISKKLAKGKSTLDIAVELEQEEATIKALIQKHQL